MKVEDETASIWKVQEGHGKPVKLSKSQPFLEWQFPIDQLGHYAMVFYSPDHLPGHTVDIMVQVFTHMDIAQQIIPLQEILPDVTDPTTLQQYFFEYSNFHHSEVMQLSHGCPVVATQWNFDDLAIVPARIRVFACRQKALKDTKFFGRLFLNPDWHNGSIPQELTPNTDFLFREQSTEEVEAEMLRHTEEREKAFNAGLIRPFLYLVSMHPYVRAQVGRVLGIEFSVKNAKSSSRTCPHKEAWAIISKPRKGITYATDHTVETLNPLSHLPTWYTCLYRALTEVHVSNAHVLKRIGNGSTLPICKDADDQTIPAMELLVLRDARTLHQKVMRKAEKRLAPKVDELMAHPLVQAAFLTLSENGIDDEQIHRFGVEICVFVYYMKRQENKESLLSKVPMSIPLKLLRFAPKIGKHIESSDIGGGHHLSSMPKNPLAGPHARLQEMRPDGGDGDEEGGDEEEKKLKDKNKKQAQKEQEHRETKEQEEERKKKEKEEKEERKRKKKERKDRKKRGEVLEPEEEEIDEEDEAFDFTAEELLHGVENQLKKGHYTPTGFATKPSLASKVGKKVVRKGIFVAAGPVAPLLMMPYSVGNFVHKNAGSNHAALWIVSVQIVLQRLVLASRGIDISDYYHDLSDEYREKQKSGGLGPREMRNAKKAPSRQVKSMEAISRSKKRRAPAQEPRAVSPR